MLFVHADSEAELESVEKMGRSHFGVGYHIPHASSIIHIRARSA